MRGFNNSYEGFRRKSSLHSTQANRNSHSPDVSLRRFKNQEKLSQVEQLSLQIDNLRKRSFTCHSQGDNHSFISNKSLIENSFEEAEKRQISHNSFNCRTIELQSDRNNIHLQKNNYPHFFNKFDVIQEDHYLNEEEVIEIVEPTIFKNNQPSMQSNPRRKGQRLKTSETEQNKKQINPPKNDLNLMIKRDKHKNDIKELQKMQKQLENKKIAKVIPTDKPAAFRKPKETIQKEAMKVGRSQAGEPKGQMYNSLKLNKNNIRSAVNIGLANKMGQSKQEQIFSMQCTEMGEKVEQMKATRMLTEKDKKNLMNRLDGLKDIIMKNEICTDNLESVLDYIAKIEDLITK